MKTADFLSTLPTEQRLALAYGIVPARELILGLLAFDSRCAGVVRGAREPLLGQLQLAWWREQLERAPERRATGEPLLGFLRAWSGEEAALLAIAEAWELLLDAPPLPVAAIERFCAARGQGWAAVARLAGCSDSADAAASAGRCWALADLAGRVSHPEEREAVLGLAQARDWTAGRLPRCLRPMTVLHGLARRVRGEREILSGPLALAVAVRLGIIGR